MLKLILGNAFNVKFGILSDAHGNALGFNACLKRLIAMQMDEILFLGDVVGYMPDFSDVISQIRKNDVRCLLGNHDAMLIGAVPLEEKKDLVYKIGDAAERMSDSDRTFFSTLKPWYEVDVNGRKLLFVHGSPRNPLNEYIYPDTDIEWFDAFKYDAFFMGHTHRPFVRRTLSNKLIANVGSCGLPRDQGNLFSFAVYDSSNHTCDIYRIEFEVERLVRQYSKSVHNVVNKCFKRQDSNIFGIMIHERSS